MATKLKTGDVAPDFELLDQKGERRRLSDFRGRWVVLYFYPKDNTPGCTKEACGFRDLFPKFQRRKIAIIGISTDSVRSHEKFAEKYDLPFILLADEEKAVVRAYGAWGQKSFMGRTTMGTHRISFLVDPEGRIAKIYDRVKPETHAEEVLRDLEELRKTG
ncbi:MAG TPA: thioredoxin-dependent thiol peroxidase [Blastocatellia bacterium]|nr:thioredoxin-dependent thiol peroxidase [Blastocatellia bacterium]